MLGNAGKLWLLLGVAVLSFISTLVIIAMHRPWMAVAGLPAGLAVGAFYLWWIWRRPGGEGRLLDQLWTMDDRAYESRWGWLMPGGIAWKLGRKDDSKRERFLPYMASVMDGWLYNAARERTVREKERKAEEE